MEANFQNESRLIETRNQPPSRSNDLQVESTEYDTLTREFPGNNDPPYTVPTNGDLKIFIRSIQKAAIFNLNEYLKRLTRVKACGWDPKDLLKTIRMYFKPHVREFR